MKYTEIVNGVVEELDIYANGIVHCSVCTNIKDEKRIEQLVNQHNPTGLSYGWHIDSAPKFATGQPNPCSCDRNPKTHKHYLMVC